MNDKVKALVLNIIDYKENDLLLQVISDDKGFLSLIVKGGKKIAAKRHFSILCAYEFIIDYKDNKTIYSIHNSKLINSYYEDNNLKLLAFKNIFIELCLKAKELYDLDMYKNIIETYEKMNEDNMYLLGSLFISYLLNIFGISPNVEGCVVCGNKKVIGISNRYGGFLCSNHINNENTQEVDYLKKFRLINCAKYDNYELIKNVTYDLKDFCLIIDFFIANSDINIKSYKFYKELYEE